MAFKCKIGFHSWDGCKCSFCEKIRDEQHDWLKDYERCSKCGKLITQNDLIAIATKNQYSLCIQEAALEKIQYSQILKAYILKGQYTNHLTAIANLADESLLSIIVKKDKDCEARQLAYKKLGKEDSQEAIIDRAKYSKYDYERESAIDKIADIDLLSNLALTGKYDIRQLAYKKLGKENCREALIDRAKYGKSDFVRESATNKITDINLLLDLAKTGSYVTRQLAYKKLGKENCQEAIIDRAKYSKYDYERESAIDKIADIDLLSDLAKTGKYEIRQLAYKKLGEENCQEAIIDRAKYSKYDYERESAIDKIADIDLLSDLAKTGKYEIRQLAYKKLGEENCQEAIIDRAKNGKSDVERKSAINKLNDIGLLSDLAKTDTNYDIRQVAYKILGEENCQDAIIDKAKNDKDSNQRMSAIGTLTDQNILADIAKNEDIHRLSESVLAASKLTDLSQKTEILLFLFEIYRKYGYGDSKLFDEIKLLYKYDLLSEEDKARILALNGKQYYSHLDSITKKHLDTPDGNYNMVEKEHSDYPSKFFNL